MEQVQAIGLVLARPFCSASGKAVSPGVSPVESTYVHPPFGHRAGVSVFKRHYDKRSGVLRPSLCAHIPCVLVEFAQFH